MTILERFKAPTKAGKAATDMSRRRPMVAAKANENAKDAARSSTLAEDARRQLSEALELTLEKVRESATLAKLQDEARHQLSEALDVARDKLKEAAPLAKAKLEDAREEVRHRLPPEQRRRSRMRMLTAGFVLVGVAIGVFLAIKRKAGLPEGHGMGDSEDIEWSPMASRTPYASASAGSSDFWTPDESGLVPAWSSDSAPPSHSSAANGRASSKTKATNVATADVSKPVSATAQRLNALLGKEVVDMDGSSVGQIDRVYYREAEGKPEWAVVTGGLAGRKAVTVPLADATIGDKVAIAYPKELIESSIDFEADEITTAQEVEADRHYNLCRDAGSETSPAGAVVAAMTLRAWPAGIEVRAPD